jgi:hypothetical protein
MRPDGGTAIADLRHGRLVRAALELDSEAIALSAKPGGNVGTADDRRDHH